MATTLSHSLEDEEEEANSNDTNLDLGGLGIGLMQWGTTGIDDRFVNAKGNLCEAVVRDIWKSCIDNRILFFDTAEGYGGGTSETRVCGVRKWYQDTQVDTKKDEDKNKVVIATKFLPTLWRWTKGAFYKSIRGSLDRLGVETIDLYYLIHTPIHPLPLEYFVQWACDAIDDGLIRRIGISNCNANQTRRAQQIAVQNGKRIECNQIMLNLLVWKTQQHRETVKTCQELGIQIVAYSPIGQGLLTDGLDETKFSSIRAVTMTGVQYTGGLQPLRKEIQKISSKYSHDNNINCTMAQVAINWVRGHGAVPLIGCRSVQQVKDAQASMEWSLTPKEIATLDDLSLGLSLFERPMYRRCLFVFFISLLQLAYYTEQRYKRLEKILLSSVLFEFKSSAHEA